MFERFTDRARRVVVLAQEEARMLNHNYIGTEHLLLGLIHEGEGVAAKALAAMEIGLEAVRQQVEEIVGRGEDAPSGHIPFTPRAKKVLELSLRESTQLGHNYIGTEHILLGLIREGEGVAAQVLTRLGADLGRTRQQVIQLLHGHQGKEAAAGFAWSRFAGRRDRLDEISGKIDTIADRLAAIEQRLGLGPGPKPEAVRRLEQRIASTILEKEEAIDAMNFERAAALRETEKQLIADHAAEESRWLAGEDDTAAEEAGRLRREIDRLQALLRGHDIEPGA